MIHVNQNYHVQVRIYKNFLSVVLTRGIKIGYNNISFSYSLKADQGNKLVLSPDYGHLNLFQLLRDNNASSMYGLRTKILFHIYFPSPNQLPNEYKFTAQQTEAHMRKLGSLDFCVTEDYKNEKYEISFTESDFTDIEKVFEALSEVTSFRRTKERDVKGLRKFTIRLAIRKFYYTSNCDGCRRKKQIAEGNPIAIKLGETVHVCGKRALYFAHDYLRRYSYFLSKLLWVGLEPFSPDELEDEVRDCWDWIRAEHADYTLYPALGKALPLIFSQISDPTSTDYVPANGFP